MTGKTGICHPPFTSTCFTLESYFTVLLMHWELDSLGSPTVMGMNVNSQWQSAERPHALCTYCIICEIAGRVTGTSEGALLTLAFVGQSEVTGGASRDVGAYLET